MNRSFLVARASVALALALAVAIGLAQAQIAGTTTVGVEVSALQELAVGWSARNQILSRSVFNDKGERLGAVDDLIIAPDKSLSFAIIGAGGFAGLGRHDVAIPVDQIHLRNRRLVIDGASKEVIRALPPFEYSTKK